MRVEKESKGSISKKKEQHASLSSQWWGLIIILVGFNVLYSSVYLSPIMDSHMLRGEKGMMKKIGKANVEAVVVNLDEKADGTTAITVRNLAESNVTLRLEIEIQNGVLWAQGQEQLLSEAWHDAAQDLRSYVLVRKHVTPTPTEWPITWIKPVQPNLPWSVHIEHEAYQIRGEMNTARPKRNYRGHGGPKTGANQAPPQKIASRFWGGAVEGASNQTAVSHRHLRIGSEHHTASHGLFFDVFAKDRPIMLTGIRFHALTSYQRQPHAPPAHVSVYSSHTTGAGTPGSTYEDREWYLIGEDRRVLVPAAPEMVDLAIQPVYIAPRQAVSIAIHSDFAFGVSTSVPSIEAVLRHDQDKLPGEDLLPGWLTLALSLGPLGVKQNEFLKVLPGLGMARQPLKQAPSAGAKGFVGLLQYRVIGIHEAQDHGLSELLQSQSSWFSHQRHRRKWRLYGEHVGDRQGGQVVAEAESEDLSSCLS